MRRFVSDSGGTSLAERCNDAESWWEAESSCFFLTPRPRRFQHGVFLCDDKSGPKWSPFVFVVEPMKDPFAVQAASFVCPSSADSAPLCAAVSPRSSIVRRVRRRASKTGGGRVLARCLTDRCMTCGFRTGGKGATARCSDIQEDKSEPWGGLEPLFSCRQELCKKTA